MNREPFTIYNWEATLDQIAKANAAYNLAAESFFYGVDSDDARKIEQLEKSLTDKIGNYFDDELTASEIAQWALSK
jgi:hypothetical protein